MREGEGSWQEYAKLPAPSLLPIPDTVTDEAAAQLVVNPVTAYGMLKDFDPPKGGVRMGLGGWRVVGGGEGRDRTVTLPAGAHTGLRVGLEVCWSECGLCTIVW